MTAVQSELFYKDYRIEFEFSYIYVGYDSPYGPIETSGDRVFIFLNDVLVDDPDSLPPEDQIGIEKACNDHILAYLHNYDSQAFYTALQL